MNDTFEEIKDKINKIGNLLNMLYNLHYSENEAEKFEDENVNFQLYNLKTIYKDSCVTLDTILDYMTEIKRLI